MVLNSVFHSNSIYKQACTYVCQHQSLWYTCSMKLNDYAQRLGISYHTAWRWFKAGQIKGYQAETGTIIVTELLPERADTPVVNAKVAVYARVSAAENKPNLDGQAQRARDYCAAKGGRSVRWSKKSVQVSMTADLNS